MTPAVQEKPPAGSSFLGSASFLSSGSSFLGMGRKRKKSEARKKSDNPASLAAANKAVSGQDGSSSSSGGEEKNDNASGGIGGRRVDLDVLHFLTPEGVEAAQSILKAVGAVGDGGTGDGAAGGAGGGGGGVELNEFTMMVPSLVCTLLLFLAKEDCQRVVTALVGLSRRLPLALSPLILHHQEMNLMQVRARRCSRAAWSRRGVEQTTKTNVRKPTPCVHTHTHTHS